MRNLVRGLGKSGLVVGLVMLVSTCSDSVGTGSGIPVTTAMDLTGLVRTRADIPIPLDSVRVRLRRADSSYAYNRAIWVNAAAIRANLDTLAITLTIDLRDASETFDFYVGTEGGGITYYEVNGTVTVRASQSTATPRMTAVYVGPGALADSVSMVLSQTAVPGGDSVLATAQVWQGGVVVPGVPVGFRSSDSLKLNQIVPTGVDGAWIRAPLTLTDSVDVIAETPTGRTTSRRLSFAPPPGQLVLSSGNNQTVAAGAPAAAPLVVQVRDAAGNPYPLGYQVDFAVVSGPPGTSVAPLSVLADNQGFAQTTLTAGGTAGAVQVSASGTNLAGSPVTFAATVTGGGGPGPADTVVIIAGNNQTAPNGTALPNPLVVEVRDQSGIPVPGATVNWSAAQGNVAPASSVTDGAGRAQTTWTLGTNQAPQSLTASVLALSPAVFNATATFATPSVLLSFSGVPGVGVGLSATVQVGLSQPAGAGGVTVTVTSDAPGTVSVSGGGTVVIPQNQTAGTVALNGLAVGSTTIRGNASGFTEGTLTVDVQDRSISLPPSLNVPYGQTASLPIQLASPAPAGGVTFDVSSDAPNFVAVQAPTVFIPAGSLTGNATLSGVLPGPATITVSNQAYSTATSAATTRASLNILQASATLNPSFGTTVTVAFESNGAGIAAPSPGVTVTVAAASPGCVAAASPVTIATGLVTTTSALSYGGSASLPCTTQLLVTAPNIQPDSISVTVNPVPGITLNAPFYGVGSGLQENTSGSLGASNHGGITLTLTSSNPAVLLLSPNASTAGTSSITIGVPSGQAFFSYYIQGVEGQTGSETITASAPGFSNGATAMAVVTPALDLQGLPANTTTLSADNAIYARVGTGDGTDNFLTTVQNVRAGAPGPLTVTFVSSVPAVGDLADSTANAASRTAVIPVGLYYTPTSVAQGGVAFHPLTSGSTAITASAPGVITLAQATRSVTVAQPAITLNSLFYGVAAGLQEAASGGLGATNHGGITLTLTSSNPGVLLLSPNATTPGAASINVSVPNGQSFFSYYVQGVEGQTGSETITATATGFTSGAMAFAVVPAALDLQGLPGTTTTLSADNIVYARVGTADGSNGFLTTVQNVRAGAPGPLVVTFTSSAPAVGNLADSAGNGATRMAEIPVGLYYTPTAVSQGGVAFHPLTAGSTTIAATSPGVTATSTATRSITVSQPAITLNGLFYGVASGLQENTGGFLGATNHGGVTVTLTSSNPAVLLLSPNSTTPGAASITIPMSNGTNSFGYYVQGVEGQTGTATITASAAGFGDGTTPLTVVQPAFDIQGLPASTTTLSPENAFYARVGTADGQNTFLTTVQNVRAGAPGPLTVTFTSSVPAVGVLADLAGSGATRQVQIPVGLYYSPTSVAAGGVAFRPVLAGSTAITGAITGFNPAPASGRTVTVSQPGITVNSNFYGVGSGLQESTSGSLGASNHGGVSVTLTSSNPGVLLLSPNATTAGTGSITIPMSNGNSFFGFYVQGVEGQTGTVTITASASGFTNGTATEAVVPAALDLQAVPGSIAAGAPDVAVYARVGTADGTNAFLTTVQNVRAGAPASLVVTFSSSAAGVATMVDATSAGNPRTAQIALGFYYTPTNIPAGGVGVRPLTPGSASITATAPGVVSTATATRAITVN